MKSLATVLSLVVALLGAIGVVSPAALLGIGRHFATPSGLYAAASLRILLGGSLFLAAATSRAPRAIRALGVFILVAGLITPFIGGERVHAILDWWSSQGHLFMRVLGSFVLAFGLILAWALFPKPSAA